MPPKKTGSNEQTGLERIVFFSDAVMAIAITLLAVDIKVPNIPAGQAAAELPRQVAALMPTLMTFFISFIVIGIYWISHHRYFSYIEHYDSRLMLLNLAFLFFIACMPFVANLLGHYVLVPFAVVIYTLAVAALGFTQMLIWFYARHKHFLTQDLKPDEIRRINIRLVVAPLMFLLAVPFAYVSSAAAITVWWLSPLAVILALRIFAGKRRNRKKAMN
jgi:uncharacterized membrane protein